MAKILLIEDNEMNRDMLARRLRRRGFEVVSAGDGHEGIATALAGPVDLILMDLSLPVLDGWQATRQLKADPLTRSIPVIALTAHAMPGDRERALEAGCDDYDTKPVDFNRLLAKIDAQLVPARAAEMTTPAQLTTEITGPAQLTTEITQPGQLITEVTEPAQLGTETNERKTATDGNFGPQMMVNDVDKVD